MIKFLNYAVTFQEFPDEIALCVNITNCPLKCDGCHSPELRKNIGVVLGETEIDELIKNNPHITLFGFMGGDSDPIEVFRLSTYIKRKYGLKVGMYSGLDEPNEKLLEILDYYKIGHYDKKLGGLKSLVTNQKFIRPAK